MQRVLGTRLYKVSAPRLGPTSEPVIDHGKHLFHKRTLRTLFDRIPVGGDIRSFSFSVSCRGGFVETKLPHFPAALEFHRLDCELPSVRPPQLRAVIEAFNA
ncbi:hypothetical protein N9C62_08340 [Luminiphilus sp.]|nr:hypothetical protein [Luminiphilus sp.]